MSQNDLSSSDHFVATDWGRKDTVGILRSVSSQKDIIQVMVLPLFLLCYHQNKSSKLAFHEIDVVACLRAYCSLVSTGGCNG